MSKIEAGMVTPRTNALDHFVSQVVIWRAIQGCHLEDRASGRYFGTGVPPHSGTMAVRSRVLGQACSPGLAEPEDSRGGGQSHSCVCSIPLTSVAIDAPKEKYVGVPYTPESQRTFADRNTSPAPCPFSL